MNALEQNKSKPRTTYKWYSSGEHLSNNGKDMTSITGSDYREIINGFFEQIIEVRENIRDQINPNVTAVYTYRINVLRKGDDIVYYKIIKEGSIPHGDSYKYVDFAVKEASADLLRNMRKEYKNKYDVDLSIGELFDHSVTFGWVCGYGASTPAPRRYINVAVKDRDISFIYSWLRSPVPEKQLYAIDAIYQLEKVGIPISADINDMIVCISQKEGGVQTCSGNLLVGREIKEVFEQIQAEHNKK